MYALPVHGKHGEDMVYLSLNQNNTLKANYTDCCKKCISFGPSSFHM